MINKLTGKYCIKDLKELYGNNSKYVIDANNKINEIKLRTLIKPSPFVDYANEINNYKNYNIINEIDTISIYDISTKDNVSVNIDLLSKTFIKYVYVLLRKMITYSNVVNLKSYNSEIINNLIRFGIICPTTLDNIFIINHNLVFPVNELDIFKHIYSILYPNESYINLIYDSVYLQSYYEEALIVHNDEYFAEFLEDELKDVFVFKSRTNICTDIDISLVKNNK